MKTRWVAVAVAAGLGCTGSSSQVRQYTYPPDFRYIAKQELHTAMHRLARDATSLQSVLERPAPLSGEDRDSVVRLLSDMQDTAHVLESGGQPTNHPMLDRNLGSFTQSIARAKEAAEANPPNFFLAGNVTGACIACHGPVQP